MACGVVYFLVDDDSEWFGTHLSKHLNHYSRILGEYWNCRFADVLSFKRPAKLLGIIGIINKFPHQLPSHFVRTSGGPPGPSWRLWKVLLERLNTARKRAREVGYGGIMISSFGILGQCSTRMCHTFKPFSLDENVFLPAEKFVNELGWFKSIKSITLW